MIKEQQDLLDEVYENYSKEYEKGNSLGLCLLVQKPDRETFINKCKTDPEFSEKWGLKIEERELSLEERQKLYEGEFTPGIKVINDHWLNSKLTTRNIPTKLITITYKDEKIESYD